MQTQAPTEPYVREFESEVTRVDGRDVMLESTHFYAESGGQPADRGTLGGERVVDVQSRDGEVVHTLAADPDLAPGDTAAGTVDDDFRTYCMRAHTASHALYGAGRRLLDDLGYGGFGIREDKVRVDFESSTEIDDEVLVELERLVNAAVWESREVSWAEVPVDEAMTREDVAFNTKTEEGVMADAEVVRVVEIEGWDAAACGGTHVANTREIGPVEVLERSNPGEGLTRVEFAVGKPGIERRAAVHRAALDAARELGVGVTDAGEAAADLRAEKERLEDRLSDMRAEVLDGRLAGLPETERDGATWQVGTVDGFGPNAVGDRAKAAVEDGQADAVAAVGSEGSTFVVVAGGEGVDAGDAVDRVTAEFGGGGGGGPAFAQGGGLSADPDEVAAFLRGET